MDSILTPEDIHVMRLNETEEEFDARLESYEGTAMNYKTSTRFVYRPLCCLDYLIRYRTYCTYCLLFIF